MQEKNYNHNKAKTTNLALDCYRARVIKVHEERPVDLDWREDILYTAPKAYPSKLMTSYRVQVLAPDKTIHELANLRDRAEARKRIRSVRHDLKRLTKMEFNKKYDIVDTTDTDIAVGPIIIDEALYGNAMLFTGVQHSKNPRNNM
ncbi:MAG TPA: hypothetical protein VGK02_03395 [Candidatus Aquicultor sp.]|jgi:hypothetical protein